MAQVGRPPGPVVCVAQIVLERLEQPDEFLDVLAFEQVFENLDRVAQFLDSNAKFVALLQGELGKTASRLFDFLIPTPDEGRRHRADRRH